MSHVINKLIPCLKNILHNYLGVVLEGTSKICSIGTIWRPIDNKKYRETLVGLMAFTTWSIPNNKAFSNCNHLRYIIGIPPTLGPNMSWMFNWAVSFNQPLNQWDVSNVENMFAMFSGASSFNQPLNKWDVSSVTNMGYMFSVASSFNQSLDQWDVSSVINMSYMFHHATSFNQSTIEPVGCVQCYRYKLYELYV